MSSLEIILAVLFIIAAVAVFIGAIVYPIISTLKRDKQIDNEKPPKGIDAKGQ